MEGIILLLSSIFGNEFVGKYSTVIIVVPLITIQLVLLISGLQIIRSDSVNHWLIKYLFRVHRGDISKLDKAGAKRIGIYFLLGFIIIFLIEMNALTLNISIGLDPFRLHKGVNCIYNCKDF